ncbi:hypothetical protein C4N9_16510 [Pararhodobacter marinus]|uniref:Uncharacterized protein n=2 Tax=Pararhodobacter marinus TaxID=2184063 RepID=A0A2U2C6W4_9RHOB|nr:hypothetical protein C4N9_16510 [Pararhodobacter marinus]
MIRKESFMNPLSLALSILLYGASTPALAQITITPPPEVSALMAACTPTEAQPDAIVAGLRGRGWSEPDTAGRRPALTALTAAHLWSFLPDHPAEAQIGLLGQLTDAVEGALQENGAFLTLGNEQALILWDGESLSCLWAGPETGTVDTLAVQLGGPFPESPSTVTRRLSQRVEAGGRNWRRQMAVARTPAEALPPDVAGAAAIDAARLDRSPE